MIKKLMCMIAMIGALTLGAIADTWADVPSGLSTGVETMSAACVMERPVGAWKETKVVVKRSAPSRSYSMPSNMSEAEAKEWIAQHESGGDYGAVSPSGKYIGRYQLSKDKLNGDYSAANQEAIADAYVKNRYGSWAKAQEHWRKYGWY